MRFRLRTLLIVLALALPVVAFNPPSALVTRFGTPVGIKGRSGRSVVQYSVAGRIIDFECKRWQTPTQARPWHPNN
jgi:hypothetical protein